MLLALYLSIPVHSPPPDSPHRSQLRVSRLRTSQLWINSCLSWWWLWWNHFIVSWIDESWPFYKIVVVDLNKWLLRYGSKGICSSIIILCSIYHHVCMDGYAQHDHIKHFDYFLKFLIAVILSHLLIPFHNQLNVLSFFLLSISLSTPFNSKLPLRRV